MTKYLHYHEKFLAEGLKNPERGNDVGLCCATKYDKLVMLFEPDDTEWNFLESAWWGGPDPGNPERGIYNDLRQTIILFCAAMNDEL